MKTEKELRDYLELWIAEQESAIAGQPPRAWSEGWSCGYAMGLAAAVGDESLRARIATVSRERRVP